jgi:AraC-like DNA-binding protein
VLLIDNADLDQPLCSRLDTEDGNVAPILERHLLELLAPPAETSRSFVARVSKLMAKRLGQGEVTIDAIAAEMSMSVRSLRRHLTEEGSSFRQILQQHRRATIEAILRDEGARLSDLAGRLSYSDGAVLSRAFKSWTGMSPREYAKAQHQD